MRERAPPRAVSCGSGRGRAKMTTGVTRSQHCATDSRRAVWRPSPVSAILNAWQLRPGRLGTGVDLNSYAELAVRLANTAGGGGETGDRLTSLDGLRDLVADREHLRKGIK